MTTYTYYEIPLVSQAQKFAIRLQGVTYNMHLQYRSVGLADWIIDIADSNNNPLVCGVPLITGADLLEQYAYLGLPGGLIVYSEGDDWTVTPTYINLGTGSHLIFVVSS